MTRGPIASPSLPLSLYLSSCDRRLDRRGGGGGGLRMIIIASVSKVPGTLVVWSIRISGKTSELGELLANA